MVFIGIDAAKDKHDCHILTSDGEVLCDNFTFQNSREGFDQLLRLIKQCTDGKDDKIKAGLESTGHYSANLLAFLKAHGFEVAVLNPLSVNRLRAAGSLRRCKTDKNDSRYIAQILFTWNSNPCRDSSYHIPRLKSLTRARFRLVKEIQPLKNRYRRLIHLLFPEFQDFFSSVYISAALNLMQAFPSAHDISACNILSLARVLSQNSHGRFKKAKAEDLKLLAKDSIGTYNPGDAFELKHTAQRIMFLESQKTEFEDEIASVMSEINSPITSVCGIGTILGATILAEIGDIRCFSNPAKLLAFAGAEPSTYQSGNYTATRTPMVKHGSRYLRNALFLAVKAARMHSPSFSSYIARKKAQGKHEYVALSHGMKKMTRIIFAVLSRNTPFTEPI